MNKIVLISSYCDTDEKLDVLNKNLDMLKDLGIDSMLNSPIPLPTEITNKCTYYFYTTQNPILHWPQRANYSYTTVFHKNKKIVLKKFYSDYGWANMYQIRKLSEISLNFDYNIFYHIIYDLKIDDVVISGLKSEDKKCNFYHFHEYDTSFHFMIFDREHLLKFLPHLTLESYLSNDGVVERWLTELLYSNQFDYILEKDYVDDQILFHSGDIYNYSKIEGLKYFIEKNTTNNIRLYFYDIENYKDIKLNINGNIYNHIISNRDIIDLGYNINNLSNTIIEYDNQSYDLTEDIKNLIINIIDVYEN
jgi:hypothetical protein